AGVRRGPSGAIAAAQNVQARRARRPSQVRHATVIGARAGPRCRRAAPTPTPRTEGNPHARQELVTQPTTPHHPQKGTPMRGKNWRPKPPAHTPHTKEPPRPARTGEQNHPPPPPTKNKPQARPRLGKQTTTPKPTQQQRP